MVEKRRFEDILYETGWHDHTVLITINRPSEQNSYTLKTLQELVQAFEDAMWDDDFQFIVLTGAGEKAFCTGGNVDEYALNYGRKPNDWWKWGEIYGRFLQIIMHCGKPVIARINGTTAGGGLEFVAAGDLAVAVENARILSPGPRVGMTSIGGLSQWLPIHSGIKRTAELVMLSSEITAKKALEWGIVNDVVPAAKLDARVKEYIDRMLDLSPTSIHYFKVHLNWWKDMVWAGTWEHAKEFFSLNIGSVEPMEGLVAFMEKRPRNYRKIRDKLGKGLEPRYPFGPYSGRCPSCEAEYLPANAVFCLKCGVKLPAPKK
ncbi:MAG: enoyl-CoA hydratase/isomerase family protein [Candidatus Thermoplasmatota archaeon]|nr:enoyl-CoA hydratase/isomerase family protein [Candidatus Thermoplasmatota archaeon]